MSPRNRTLHDPARIPFCLRGVGAKTLGSRPLPPPADEGDRPMHEGMALNSADPVPTDRHPRRMARASRPVLARRVRGPIQRDWRLAAWHHLFINATEYRYAVYMLYGLPQGDAFGTRDALIWMLHSPVCRNVLRIHI